MAGSQGNGKLKPSVKLIAMERYDVKNEPTILSKPLLDLLLSQERPLDVLGLYVFYYYTAKWQGTSSPKAVNAFVKKRLKLGSDRMHAAKAILLDLGLIKNKTLKNTSGKIIGHYIHVNILYDKNDVNALFKNREISTGKQTGLLDDFSKNIVNADGFDEKTTVRQNQTVENRITNTKNKNKEEERIKLHCSNKNVRTDSARTRTVFAGSSLDKFRSFAERIFEMVRKKKNIKVTNVKLKESVEHIRKLFQLDMEGSEKEKYSQMRKALEYLETNMYEDTYCPIVESGASFRKKFLNVLNAIERTSKPAKQSGNRRVIIDDAYFIN